MEFYGGLFLAALLGYLIYEKNQGNGAGWFPGDLWRVPVGAWYLLCCSGDMAALPAYREADRIISDWLYHQQPGRRWDPHFSGAESLVSKMQYLMQSQEMLNLNKRQAQYLALQNQINPHFLYNTLESIRSEALIAGLVSVADMTEALGHFFPLYHQQSRKSGVSGRRIAELYDLFLKIQQYRFGDRLQLSVECDPEEKAAIYSCRIPNLTLQPILENSIIHGTECKLGTGHIRILLEMTESCLLLCISDDGNGMEERKVADINERLQKSGGILATGESETKGGSHW